MRAVVIAGVVLGLSAQAAAADLVIESYTSARPESAARVMGVVRTEFRALGYAAEPSGLGDRISAAFSRAAGPMSDDDAETTRRQVEDGYSKYLAGDFAAAIDALKPALGRLVANPASLALDPSLRDAEHKALIGLALAHKRLGNADEAARHMSELVRSFPDRDVSRAFYGPEAVDLYRGVKSELERQGRGTLRVEVDDSEVVVFLNERYEAVGTAARKVLPGTYRVYTQKGTIAGRMRTVEVAAGQEARVFVSWKFDTALRTGSEFAGFIFSAADDRQKYEATYAIAVARALEAPRIVVLTIDVYQGRQALIGQVLPVDGGRPSRMAVLALEPVDPGDDQVRGLARFLAGGQAVPGLILPTDSGGSHEPREAWYADRWGWGITAAGFVVAGVGAGFLINASLLESDADAADEIEAPKLYDRAADQRTIGAVATIIGGVGLTVGIVKLVLHDDRPSAAPRTEVAFGLGWIGLRGTF